MAINGVEVHLDYANVLGGTGIKLGAANSSTIQKTDVDDRLSSIEPEIGTTAYVIATSDGTINAIVTETVSGTASITNNYVLRIRLNLSSFGLYNNSEYA